MNKPKGGRGVTAPYETTHVRVPVPIKAKVDRLIEEYRELIFEAKIPERDKFNCSNAMTLTTVEEAKALAQSILKQKKSAKLSLEKLLTALYEGEVKL